MMDMGKPRRVENLSLCLEQSPCRGCTARAAGCHGACARYAEYAARRREEQDKRLCARHADEAAYTATHERAARRRQKARAHGMSAGE